MKVASVPIARSWGWLSVCALFGGLVPVVVQVESFPSVPLAASGGAIALIWAASRTPSMSWLAPPGLPLLYIALVYLGPIVYVQSTGSTLNGLLTGTELSRRVMLLHLAFVLACAIGIMSVRGLRPVRGRSAWLEERQFSTDVGRMARIGLAGVCVYRLGFLLIFGTRSFGVVTSFDSGLLVQLEPVVIAIALACVLLLLMSDLSKRSVVSRIDAFLLLTYVGSTLLIGERDDVIPVAVVVGVVWIRRSVAKKLQILAVTAAIAGLLVGVGVWRVARGIDYSVADSAVRTIASPTNISARLVPRIATEDDLLLGETYASSAVRLAPLGLADVLRASQTASERFPDLIFFSARQGLGFSPLAEGYWNFGFLGVLLVGCAIGALLQASWGWFSHDRFSAMSATYIVILARLPISLRSDALQTVKGALYPMLVLIVVTAVHAYRVRRRAQPAVRGGVPG